MNIVLGIIRRIKSLLVHTDLIEGEEGKSTRVIHRIGIIRERLLWTTEGD